MKKILILLVVLSGWLACAIVYFGRQKTPAPAPVVESTPAPVSAPPEEIAPPKRESPAPAPVVAATPVKVAPATPSEPKLDDSKVRIRQAVDTLLSAKTAETKHAVFQQLIKDGQLDAAMDELKRRMVDDPGNAQIPTTLGEAQLNKVRLLKESGAEVNELGILAMQADQSFNAALKIDANNWEANFMKASSMYYWPANEERDAQVVQRLSSLIDQQDTMTPNPAFAQTYLVLGNQFLKIGQPDKAMGTWQLGLQKFPNDPALIKKINGK